MALDRNPAVSIVTATYNRSQVLRLTIEALQRSTFTDWELLVVGDACTGALRPALVVIPPRVWHGVQNLSSVPSAILNLVDRAYDYQDPDHWRVPHDSPQIPFRF